MSFAAEMKDFVGAWTAVSAMGNDKKKLDLQKMEIENLQQYREDNMALDREKFELSRSNANRNYALAQERNQISREAAASAKAAEAANSVLESMEDYGGDDGNFDFTPVGSEPSVYVPNTEPMEAIPTAPANATGNFSEDFGMFSRGGMVAKAAEGGLIEEDPAMPFVDKQNPYVDPKMNEMARRQAAIPTGPNEPLPVSASTAPPKRPAQPDPKAAQSVASDAQAAVADAAPALIADAQAPKTAVGPDAEIERMDIVNNQGGLSMEEYKELIATIDPNDSIPAYLKSAAVLASTHRYFTEQGQPAKAQRIAKGILILNKQMTQTLGALAQNAMEEGDVPAAAQLVTDAANQMPTADQFKVSVGENGLTYTRMQGGKEAESGQLTTEQLWELTGKVKNGSLFIQEMGRLAEPTESKKIGPTQALELTSNAYVTAIQAQDALAVATEEGADEEELNALRNAARNAAATYTKFRNNTLQMGVNRTDIQAMNNEALEMAIPDATQPEGGEGGVTSDGNSVQFDDLPAPKTRADRDALPPGTTYVAPDGSIRTR